MDEREKRWKTARCGNITSSSLAKLCTKGTKGREYGDQALGYLYEKMYERRTGKPIRNDDNKNFRWGHEQEEVAMAWLGENTMWYISDCTRDGKDIVFVKPWPDVKYGDSPDFYVLSEDGGCVLAVGEIKCVVSQSKFEKYRLSTPADLIDEYKEQLAAHLMAHPGVDTLYYVIYDGQAEDDELDLIDPMDASRGIIIKYTRSDFGDLISWMEDKIRECDAAVDEAIRLGVKIETILNN